MVDFTQLAKKLRTQVFTLVSDERIAELLDSMHRDFTPGDVSRVPWDLARPGAEVGTQNYELSGHFRNVLAIAQGVANPTSRYFADPAALEDVVKAMEWLLHNAFCGNINHQAGKDILAMYYGAHPGAVAERGAAFSANWWHYDIGMPLLSGQILALVGEHFPPQLVADYVKHIHIYTPNATARVFNSAPLDVKNNQGAANMAEKCVMMMIHGILAQDENRVRQAAAELLTPLTVPYQTPDGAGYHWDGSYIEHGVHPYALGYGIVALSSICEVMGVLGGETLGDGSPIAFDKERLEILARMVEKTWLMSVWQGEPMHNLRGRGISRQGEVGNVTIRVVRALLGLANVLPQAQQALISRTLQRWVQGQPSLLASPYPYVNEALAKICGESPQGSNIARDPVGVFAYNNQCRVVRCAPTHAFSVSSNGFHQNIAPAKIGNGENVKGVFMGEGMTYLYLAKDRHQYEDGYFASVDYRRLPGITLETGFLIEELPGGIMENTEPNPRHVWSGTVTLDGVDLGSTGFVMDLGGRLGLDLKANKSWFYLSGGYVLALGSNITSTSGQEVYTVVENRRLPQGVESGFQLHEVPFAPEAICLRYQSGHDTARIGYYVPSGQKKRIQNLKTVGSWSGVNVNGSEEVLQDWYAHIIINHGANPRAANYEYVIYPDVDETDIAAFATDQSGEAKRYAVLRQDEAVHGVYDFTEQTLFMHNFSDTPMTLTSPVTGQSYRVDQTACVVICEKRWDEGLCTIGMLDPTTGERSVKVTTCGKTARWHEGDENVAVENTDKGAVVRVLDPLCQGQRYRTWQGTVRL